MPFETADSLRSAGVRQVSVFLDDRVGALMRLFQTFEGSNIKVLALSVVHAIDCAIVRLLFDDTDKAIRLMRSKNFPCSETELLVVEVPHGHGLISICGALLAAEVNIDYAYPLLVRPTGRAALAIHTDNIEAASAVLKGRKFTLMTEDDLGPGQIR
jgi:hypothetical protein